MARPTPHLDRAVELATDLRAHLAIANSHAISDERAAQLAYMLAIVEAHLAIAEALHGVIYVANANAV